MVTVGSLDDPSKFKPAVVVYAAKGYDWDTLAPGLKRFPGMPPG